MALAPSGSTGFVGADAPHLEDIGKCIRCAACLESCPTYQLLGLEADSPRGRLQLMRGVAEGWVPLGDSFALHMERCLQCRACETVCPAGVPFGRAMMHARTQIARQRPSALTQLTLQHLLPHPQRLRSLARAARGYQRSALRPLLRLLLPGQWRALEELLPVVPERPFSPPKDGVAPAKGDGGRAILFLGCIMPALCGPTHEATVRVLNRNGCTVLFPPGQTCCGALHAHNGLLDEARALARRNIDAFAGDEPIIVNAAGCGALLKEYGDLLADDPAYAERARAFSARVQDFSEFLCQISLEDFGPLPYRATYQDPCHLAHGQGIRRQPRQLLQAIPGLDFVELPDADRCCGSAGIYNLAQPDLAMQLLDRKMDDITATGADLIVTANPGCLFQLQAGLRRRGLHARVAHLAEVLDEAYEAHDLIR